MKRLLPILVVALIPFAGCGKKEPASQSTPPPAPSDGMRTNQQDSTGQALEKYGRTMATVKKSTEVKMDLITVNNAILAFQADRGENPSSLDELVTEKFLPKLPPLPSGKKYSYNPQTGEVKVVDGN